VDITGLEARRSDLARGILIARSTRLLTAAEQAALWAALAAAGVTEQADEDTEDEPDRQWHAAPWIPPDLSQVDPQRIALEATADPFAIEAVWLVKIETSIDGVAWLEMTATEAPSVDEDEDDDDEPGPSEVVDAVFDDSQEVIYAAPDAAEIEASSSAANDDEDDADDEDEHDDDENDDEDELDEMLDDDELEVVPLESHWRAGAPPFEHSVPFPIERYPEIIDDYDWESFGIAFKLAGQGLAGEESVVNAFFALWLSIFQDERVDESGGGPGYEPFQRADVIHDRRHRSALMWVERFSVPATASDQVHFLLWIMARLHEILPIAWARFDAVDDAVKTNATDAEEPFVLAGNPFAERFQRHGEDTAMTWAASQAMWSKRELAGMLVEVALEHDPDNAETAATAERLLRRAMSFEPKSEAAGYLSIVLVRQRRTTEAIAVAKNAPSRDVRLLVIGEIAEHSPGELPPALDLLDAETSRETGPEELADLTASVARHAPIQLPALLAKLPNDVSLVPHLYNSSFSVDRHLALLILRRVLSLPPPPRDAGEARTALVMAWNNACIHAHALGDYKLAVELADGGQQYGPENPYIYHSAACAYAAVGQIDRALEQVQLAIEHNYEHTEKMETDADLSPLHSDPRFASMFNEWREKRADLN
jgi:tetratricopeptide (TPR) repeat protein